PVGGVRRGRKPHPRPEIGDALGVRPVVTDAVPILEDETGFDRLLGFTLPDRHARGRIVRLGPVLEEILAAHDYPPAIKGLLAEALLLTALIGGLLKHEGSQLTMQAQAEGATVS